MDQPISPNDTQTQQVQTTPSQQVQQPQPPQPSQQSPPPVEPGKKSKKLIFLPILALVVLLVGVGGYFLANAINTPTRVKEKVETTQPVFDDYSRTIKKIVDNLIEEDSSGSDSDSFAREVQKGNNLIQNAEKDRNTLMTVVGQIDMQELEEYEKRINEYINKSDELVEEEKESMKLLSAYIDPIKDYEELTLSISGVSTYMYSDPDRYVSSMAEAIDKEEQIIKKFEAIQIEGDMKEYNNVFIKTLRVELDLLKQIKTAVENRSTEEITAAMKKYAEGQQKNAKEINRVSDKIDEKVKTKQDNLETLEGKVKQAYDDLRRKYKF